MTIATRNWEWLKEQEGIPKVSIREIGRRLNVHHETVRKAINEGKLGDTLRKKIRAYRRAHPEEEGDEARQEPSGPLDGTEPPEVSTPCQLRQPADTRRDVVGEGTHRTSGSGR